MGFHKAFAQSHLLQHRATVRISLTELSYMHRLLRTATCRKRLTRRSAYPESSLPFERSWRRLRSARSPLKFARCRQLRAQEQTTATSQRTESSFFGGCAMDARANDDAAIPHRSRCNPDKRETL